MGVQGGRPSRINICTMLYVLGVDFRWWRSESRRSRELSAAGCALYTALICGCKRGLRIDAGISLITRKCCRCPPLIRSQMFHSSRFSHLSLSLPPFLSLPLAVSVRHSSRISSADSTNGRLVCPFAVFVCGRVSGF